MNDNKMDLPLPFNRSFHIPPEFTKLEEKFVFFNYTGPYDSSWFLVFGTAKEAKRSC